MDDHFLLMQTKNQLYHDYIELEDGERINKPEFLKEYFDNSNSQITKLIQDHLADVSKSAGLKPVNVLCSKCTKSYAIELMFDYASFFDQGS